MPPTVDFPTLVNQALDLFGDVFDNEPARRHFAEYLTGLMVAERKNISAINRQFATTTDQSCLNRWFVESDWDAVELNDRRLDWLQDNPNTRYSPRGVIAIDNTLVDHSDKLIEDVGWLWDPAHPSTILSGVEGSGAPRHRPRLPDFQLRLSLGQPLSNRVATVQEKGRLRASGLQGPHPAVPRLDRRCPVTGHPWRLHL